MLYVVFSSELLMPLPWPLFVALQYLCCVQDWEMNNKALPFFSRFPVFVQHPYSVHDRQTGQEGIAAL